MASHSTHVEPMYYEVLDISLQELEQLKTLKVGSGSLRGWSSPPPGQRLADLTVPALCFDLWALARWSCRLPQALEPFRFLRLSMATAGSCCTVASQWSHARHHRQEQAAAVLTFT